MTDADIEKIVRAHVPTLGLEVAPLVSLGRAIIAALTPSAPVAVGLTDDGWIDIAERHACRDWNSNKPDGYLKAVKALCLDFAALTQRPTPPATAQDAGTVADLREVEAFVRLHPDAGLRHTGLRAINRLRDRLAAPSPASAPAAEVVVAAVACRDRSASLREPDSAGVVRRCKGPA